MHPYLNPLVLRFQEQRDPLRAAAMKQYMRGQFDYIGMNAPKHKELSRQHIREMGFPDEEEVEPVVHDCWKMDEREYQYFAMILLSRMAKKAPLCRVDLYEYMVREKSWWDTIDFIASNLVGVHFQRFPDAIKPYTTQWMNSGNRWLQRVCLLFQLKYKQKTDLELLDQFIKELHGSKEFFINKAIGWILREYSKTDRHWVLDYVERYKADLAPLSQREALKWLKNQEAKNKNKGL
jgi:3-methyladenine DNA glycosylase AlkD